MNEDKKGLIKTLAVVSSLGLSIVLAIAFGVIIGLKLDEWLGTHPWFFFIFLFIGIAAGFRNIYVIASRELRKEEQGEDKRR